MRKLTPIVLLTLLSSATAVHTQNTPARSTPQTGSSAPAATGSAAQSAQAAESRAAHAAASRSTGSANRGNAAGGTRGGNAPGITGVPRYRAGFRGPRGTAAATGTASVTVTGDSDGSSRRIAPAVLPGVAIMGNAFGIAKGTPIQVRLQQPVDSGHAKNGDMVPGVLVSPVGSIPAGAPVQLTVVAVAAAGQMTSNGELSLQVVSVDGKRVLSDVITAEGKEGTKLLPDAAPGRGTEAIFPADQPITLPAG